MADVVLYGTHFCSYCMRARMLLDEKGVPFRDVDVGDRASRAALTARTGSRLVPQIYINERLIGGFSELAALDARGEAADQALIDVNLRNQAAAGSRGER